MAKSPRPKPLLAEEKPLRSRPRKPRDPAQPRLPFDPMPDRVEPCLALLKPRPPVRPDWTYEVKWDGYRIAVHLNNGNVRIITRGGHDWTHRFPGIEDAIAHTRVVHTTRFNSWRRRVCYSSGHKCDEFSDKWQFVVSNATW